MNSTEVTGLNMYTATYEEWKAMSVIKEIAAERQRQIDEEGRTAEHDDEHDKGEMVAAAVCYCLPYAGKDSDWIAALLKRIWPWSWPWWKPKDRRRDLIRAGALIVAEIERLDRLEQKP